MYFSKIQTTQDYSLRKSSWTCTGNVITNKKVDRKQTSFFNGNWHSVPDVSWKASLYKASFATIIPSRIEKQIA